MAKGWTRTLKIVPDIRRGIVDFFTEWSLQCRTSIQTARYTSTLPLRGLKYPMRISGLAHVWLFAYLITPSKHTAAFTILGRSISTSQLPRTLLLFHDLRTRSCVSPALSDGHHFCVVLPFYHCSLRDTQAWAVAENTLCEGMLLKSNWSQQTWQIFNHHATRQKSRTSISMGTITTDRLHSRGPTIQSTWLGSNAAMTCTDIRTLILERRSVRSSPWTKKGEEWLLSSFVDVRLNCNNV